MKGTNSNNEDMNTSQGSPNIRGAARKQTAPKPRLRATSNLHTHINPSSVFAYAPLVFSTPFPTHPFCILSIYISHQLDHCLGAGNSVFSPARIALLCAETICILCANRPVPVCSSNGPRVCFAINILRQGSFHLEQLFNLFSSCSLHNETVTEYNSFLNGEIVIIRSTKAGCILRYYITDFVFFLILHNLMFPRTLYYVETFLLYSLFQSLVERAVNIKMLDGCFLIFLFF